MKQNDVENFPLASLRAGTSVAWVQERLTWQEKGYDR